jgi:membrane protein required for colicin V production
MPIYLVDILIALPLIGMLLKGLKNGFVHETLTLVGQVLAVFLAFTYMEQVGTIVKSFLGFSGPALPLIAFLLIYIIFIILTHIVIKLINSLVKVAYLSVFNMLLGALFSTFKAVLLVSVVLILLAGFNLPAQESRSESYLYAYVVPIAPATYNVIATFYPGANTFRDEAGGYIDRFNPLKDLNTNDN